MPVDFEKAEEKVEKASGFFDTLNAFIKKHPIWSVIIAIVALGEFGYLGWDATHDTDEEYYDDEYYQDDYSYDDESFEDAEDTTYYYQEQYSK